MSIINKQQFKETFPTIESFTNMLDKSEEEYQHIQQQLESDYNAYCEHINNLTCCDDKPLSYDVWLHTDITTGYVNPKSKSHTIDDLPF